MCMIQVWIKTLMLFLSINISVLWVCQVLLRLSGVFGDHGRTPAAVAELPCDAGAETVEEPAPAVVILKIFAAALPVVDVSAFKG